MPKKSKKKDKDVKQIPAKVGAKAKTKSGDKVEVVLNTTRVVKDKRRGKYKPRKKTNKKQDSKSTSALTLLREQIELEKLRKEQEAVRFQPQQRFRNNRSGNDINNFFNKSRNDGTKEVVGELSKQVKSLRDELKKSKESKPEVEEKPEEPKSKFKEELETTQNEIQRERIRRGIARRDEQEREKNLQKQIEKVEKQQKIEQSRIRVATRKLSKERTANRQAQSVDENKKALSRAVNRTPTIKADKVVDDILDGEKEKVIQLTAPISTAVFQRDEKLSTRRPKSQAINKAVETARTPTAPPQRINRRPDIAEKLREGGIGIQKVDTEKEETEEAFKQAKELYKNKQKEKQKEIETQKPLFLDDDESIKKIFPEQKEESFTIEDKPTLEDISSDLTEQVLEESLDELTEEERKERRRSFTADADADDNLQSKTKEEVEKLRQLQIDGDKAYADRVQAQLRIAENERIGRDLLLNEARKKNLAEDEKLNQYMRDLKDSKQREKKKARDNLRKRQQQEFLDEVAGEVVDNAIGGAIDDADKRNRFRNKLKEKERQKASAKLVSNVFSNVVGGRGLAQEIISANQKIPRTPNNVSQIQDKIENLKYSDYTKTIGRKAYTEDDAKRIFELRKNANNLKEKLSLLFPKYIKQNMFKAKQSLRTSNKIISGIMDSVKEDGELTGLQAVKLKRLLDELASMLNEIVDIEDKYRDRTKFEKETQEQRRLRIRSKRNETDEQPIKDDDEKPIKDDTDEDVDLDEI